MTPATSNPRRIVTPAERLLILAWGDQRRRLTNKAIARELGLAENTVAKVLHQERKRRG